MYRMENIEEKNEVIEENNEVIVEKNVVTEDNVESIMIKIKILQTSYKNLRNHEHKNR